MADTPDLGSGPVRGGGSSPLSRTIVPRETLGHGHGFEHGFGFVDCLLEFQLGDGIVDPSAAGLGVGDAVFDQGGADGDAAVEVAVEGKIADASAVGAAGGLLEFGDDLHGADFRGAAEGAGGEGGAHEAVDGLSGGKMALDLGNDVHDVAVTLDDHQFLDLHGAKIADAADVVSGEIDEHDVFGAFLGIGQQFAFQGLVFLGGLAAAPGAGDGANLDVAVFAADMGFRGGADEGESLQLEQKHVGRGIDGAGGAINVQRGGLDRGGKSLGADDLDDVAAGDVFFAALDVGEESLARDVGTEGGVRQVAGDINGQMLEGLLQQGDDALDFADGIFVGVLGAGRAIENCGDEGGDGLGGAVEDEQFIGDEEIHDRRLQVVARRSGDDRLDVVNKLVTDESDGAAPETGQAGGRGRPIAAHDLFPPRQAVPDPGSDGETFDGFAVFEDVHAVGGLFDDGAGIASDEGVTANMLAAFDGLEEEGFARAADFSIDRERSLQVGQNAAGDGNEVALGGALQELRWSRIIHWLLFYPFRS